MLRHQRSCGEPTRRRRHGPWQNLGMAAGWPAPRSSSSRAAGEVAAAVQRSARVDPEMPRSSDERSASERIPGRRGAARAMISRARGDALLPAYSDAVLAAVLGQRDRNLRAACHRTERGPSAGPVCWTSASSRSMPSGRCHGIPSGSLPVKPPSWLELTPLLAIPVAARDLPAGRRLARGADASLRGDYLAIVTLGLGEIIRIIAVMPTTSANGSRRTRSASAAPGDPHRARSTWCGARPAAVLVLLLFSSSWS